jgi:large subunit ribosomal protein L25
MKPGEIEITVQNRNPKGLSTIKVRKQHLVPGIVYGSLMKQSVPFSASEKVLKKYTGHSFENVIFTLKSEDKALNDLKVIVKHCDTHPITRMPLHVDFMAIDMNKPIRVPVELRFVGKAEGLTSGGSVQAVMRDLEVWVLPTQIPTHIEVDVTPLSIGDSLHINDLKLPAGVKPASNDNLTVVTCVYIKEETIVAAAPTAAAAEPEVIGKGKKPEEGAAAAAGAKAPAAGAKAPAAKTDKK